MRGDAIAMDQRSVRIGCSVPTGPDSGSVRGPAMSAATGGYDVQVTRPLSQNILQEPAGPVLPEQSPLGQPQ